MIAVPPDRRYVFPAMAPRPRTSIAISASTGRGISVPV